MLKGKARFNSRKAVQMVEGFKYVWFFFLLSRGNGERTETFEEKEEITPVIYLSYGLEVISSDLLWQINYITLFWFLDILYHCLKLSLNIVIYRFNVSLYTPNYILQAKSGNIFLLRWETVSSFLMMRIDLGNRSHSINMCWMNKLIINKQVNMEDKGDRCYR